MTDDPTPEPNGADPQPQLKLGVNKKTGEVVVSYPHPTIHLDVQDLVRLLNMAVQLSRPKQARRIILPPH